MQTLSNGFSYLLFFFTLNHFSENSAKCDRKLHSSSHLYLTPWLSQFLNCI